MAMPRREMPAALLDGRIYVTGGIGDNQVLSTVEVYDPARDSWSPAPPLPEPRHHHGAAAVNGKLYVIGGYSNLGAQPWRATETLFEYDPATRVWRRRSPLPEARGAMAVAALDGRIYVFGGAIGPRDSPSTFIYDPATDRWSQGAPMPTSREHVAAVAVGSTIYVAGGRPYWDGQSIGGGNVRAMEAYSPEANSWRRLYRMEVGRSGHGLAAVGGKIYAFGGELLGNGSIYASVEEYDPATDLPREMRMLPEARTGLAAVGVDSVIYVIGGSGSSGTDNLVFHPR